MSTSLETGHAKNAILFDKLIANIKDYGTAYNPSSLELQLPNLETLLADAQAKLADVVDKNNIYNQVVHQRQAAFADFKKLSTRLINALQITEASIYTIKNAKTFQRKIQGRRAKPLPPPPTDPNAIVPKTISVSHQSYEQLIYHFAGLISVLASVPSYAPNEVDLQVATLKNLKDDLELKNLEVIKAVVALSSARISRDKVLYGKTESVHAIGSKAKKYILATFGSQSNEYAQIKSLNFQKVKKI